MILWAAAGGGVKGDTDTAHVGVWAAVRNNYMQIYILVIA